MINTGYSNVLEKPTAEGQVTTDRSFDVATSSVYSGARTDSDYMSQFTASGCRIEEELSAASDSRQIDFDLGANDDTVPSGITMQYVNGYSIQDEEEAVGEKSYKISARGKIMITVYALVVATIIALIAMNAHVLRTMEKSIQDKQTAVAQLAEQNEMLAAELEYVSSEQTVSEKAIEMGMVK